MFVKFSYCWTACCYFLYIVVSVKPHIIITNSMAMPDTASQTINPRHGCDSLNRAHYSTLYLYLKRLLIAVHCVRTFKRAFRSVHGVHLLGDIINIWCANLEICSTHDRLFITGMINYNVVLSTNNAICNFLLSSVSKPQKLLFVFNIALQTANIHYFTKVSVEVSKVDWSN